jgi:hypothetical protein
VLTRFTVQQALEELLDQDGRRTTAEEILGLSICEPALGSGAFAIEAVDQLAREYLSRRQDELGLRLDPDQYPKELQKVKAHIALHQVYGVDLNATAVELAEVSLWLSTMVEGLQAPWFGLRLRRGNSLIGARRSAYSVADVRNKAWLKSTPNDLPLSVLAEEMEEGRVGSSLTGRVFHFLLPAEGWGSAVEVPKDVRDLVPDAVRALKAWRSSVRRTPTKKQVEVLLSLSQRAEQLWHIALRRLRIAEAESGRNLDLWGLDRPTNTQALSREQIEESLADENGAYRRLRRVMDAWCALWFWPLTETDVEPPTLEQWLDALTMLLGRDTRDKRRAWMPTFQDLTDWEQLGQAEDEDLIYSGAARIQEVLDAHPWLKVANRVAARQGFFHWELDFAPVFAGGGFSLQIGNPPWVRPEMDIDAVLAEGDPWWALKLKPSEGARRERRAQTLSLPGVSHLLIDSAGEMSAVQTYLGSPSVYPGLQGLPPNLYRSFMEQTWRHGSPRGTTALIHPAGHFTENGAGLLRERAYKRLRRSWNFINELKFFEIGNLVTYGVHIYGAPSEEIRFIMASGLYHPETAQRSLVHDGSGEAPSAKNADGSWDLRPHASRIVEVTDATLRGWHSLLGEADGSYLQARMLFVTNAVAASVLQTFAGKRRISELGLQGSRGWSETADRQRGRFAHTWHVPNTWGDAILQGPHLHVATPFYKFPNPTLRSHRDWTPIDLERLRQDEVPPVAYAPVGSRSEFEAAYDKFDTGEPAHRHYRIAWRRMANNTGERTLIPAIIPPGATHVHPVSAAGAPRNGLSSLVVVEGIWSSLIADFMVRSVQRADIYLSTLNRFPMVVDEEVAQWILLRALRLNCVTEAYGDLWAACWNRTFCTDSWAAGRPRWNRPELGNVGDEWSIDVPLRINEDRRNALVELDALVALGLGIPVDDLCAIYRTQFAVLYSYESRQHVYDANGRVVPREISARWQRKGADLTIEERAWKHPGSGALYVFELPFRSLDRERDMRAAYAEFKRRLDV